MASLGGFESVLTFLLFLFVGLMFSSSEAAIKKYQFDVSCILIIFNMLNLLACDARFP